MSFKGILISFVTGMILFSCGTTTTRINFDSSPSKADIYIRTHSNDEYKKIGETPLVYRADEIERKLEGSGPLEIEYRKKGYRNSSVYVTELSAMDLEIEMELISENGLEDQKLLNWVIDSMFEIKRLVSTKRYDDALSKIKSVKEAVPQVSAVYELEGGIYFLQRKYFYALDAYETAVRYNPNNLELIRMRDICSQKVKK